MRGSTFMKIVAEIWRLNAHWTTHGCRRYVQSSAAASKHVTKMKYVYTKTKASNQTLLIRPHRSTYVDAAYCYRPSSVVCRSVLCLWQSWATQKRLKDRDAVWDAESNGPKEPRIRWEYKFKKGRGTFRGVSGQLQSIRCWGIGWKGELCYNAWTDLNDRPIHHMTCFCTRRCLWSWGLRCDCSSLRG